MSRHNKTTFQFDIGSTFAFTWDLFVHLKEHERNICITIRCIPLILYEKNSMFLLKGCSHSADLTDSS